MKETGSISVLAEKRKVKLHDVERLTELGHELEHLGLKDLEEVAEILEGLRPEITIKVSGRRPSQSLSSTKEIVDKFLAAKHLAERSEVTLRRYAYILYGMARRFPYWPTISSEIENYLVPFPPPSRRQYYNVMAIFFTWAARREKLPNPLLDIEKPRVKEKPQLTLWLEQAKEVEINLADPRERAIFALGYGMGWRLSEISQADFEDIGAETIVVRGKERDEIVSLEPIVRERLFALANGASPKGPIFQGQRGSLSPWAIWRIVKGMLGRVGVEGSPHTLRHGYGTALALQGCDAHTIMRLMRHKKISQAIRYLHYADPHLAERQRVFSPLARLTANKKAIFIGSFTTPAEPAPKGQIVPTAAGKRPDFDYGASVFPLPDPSRLPELLDEMIALGETTHEFKRALGGNGHWPDQVEELLAKVQPQIPKEQLPLWR